METGQNAFIRETWHLEEIMVNFYKRNFMPPKVITTNCTLLEFQRVHVTDV